MNLGPAVERLGEAERALASDFRKLGERHAVEHDVYHQTSTFAKQCEAHAERLAPIAERYGSKVPDERDGEGLWDSALETVRRRGAELTGRRPASGLLLLRDLRELYLAAQETLVTWVIVNQGAMAARDEELLELVRECHLETELQMRWTLTKLKEAAPQALMS